MANGRKSWTFLGWLYLGLGIAAAVAAIWLVWSLQASREYNAALQSGPDVTVLSREDYLALLPAARNRRTALLFISGSGVDAEAYAVLLRPLATAGYPVFILRLPYERAFLHVQKPIVFERLRRVIADHPEIPRWVFSGHSVGAALSVLFAHAEPAAVSGLVLIATTYPTDVDLSALAVPVSQIYAERDGMVAPGKVQAAGRLLPPHTRWIEIVGGNHSQFGRYTEKVFDGEAAIPRERQEALTRAEISRVLAEVDSRR